MEGSGSRSSGGGELLERETELSALTQLARAASRGRGAIAVIAGRPGEGKTSLLHAACWRAERAGLLVLRARGRELETGFALGVARQLFEPPLAALDKADRARLLRGAARLGASVLDLKESRPAQSPFAVLHGLHWLLAGLASRQPLVVAIDDAHSADPASLEWIAYLRERIEELPVLVLLATRPAAYEARAATLDTLLAGPSVSLIQTRPLSERSVAVLVERSLGRAPDARFSAACFEATAGNPLAVTALVDQLARGHVQPSAESAGGLAEHAPEMLRRNVLSRLATLGDDAATIARSAAVLGERSDLEQLAALADMPVERAADSLDALVSDGILASSTQGLAFVHPLMRAAVYDSLPQYRRAALHGRAGDLLVACGSEPEPIAAQFLRAEPARQPERVDSLRRAAAIALRRGAPPTAVIYLRRALAEPPSADERTAVLAELGRAEVIIRDPQATSHLAEAVAGVVEASKRAQLQMELAECVFWAGRWEEAMRLFDSAIEELGEHDRNLSLRLEGDRLSFLLAFASHSGRTIIDGNLERLLRRAREDRESARPLCLSLALLLALRLHPAGEVRELVERGLAAGRFLEVETSESLSATHGAIALILAEDLSTAIDFTNAMMAESIERGSVFGFVAGSTHRALTHLHLGALAEAEADASAALDLTRQHDLSFAEPFPASYLALILLEQGRSEEAEALLDKVVIAPRLLTTAVHSTLLDARGAVRQACGNLDGAIEDLRACGEIADALSFRHPLIYGWRSRLALALAAEDPDGARLLVESELADAHTAQCRRGVGVALRSAGMLAPAQQREGLLNESVAALEGTSAPLELAHTLVTLGAELRRQRSPVRARDPLRRGLDLAQRCGAAPLVGRAHDELLAAGARPRRLFVTGVDALTPSELRVVRLVAAGHTNREVAESLFITTKTVKDHLTSAYRKLGIASRQELATALADQAPKPTAD